MSNAPRRFPGALRRPGARRPVATTVAVETETDSAVQSGKGRPTPTRREREAANLRPLVSNDRRAANKVSRAKMTEVRDRARVGMANGEEKYLLMKDRGPQRRFVRDYVDARFSLGEVLIPIMFVFILGSLVPSIASYLLIAVYAFFLLAVIDAVILGFLVTKRLAAKFGASEVQRGTRWYAAMRAVQLRRLRLPKPQVKRGAYPE